MCLEFETWLVHPACFAGNLDCRQFILFFIACSRLVMCLEFETWLVQPVCFAGSLRPWPGRRQHGCGTSSTCQPDREHFRLDWIVSGTDHDLRQWRPGCAWRQGDSHRVAEPGWQHPVARWWEPHADPRWRRLASGRGNKGENKTHSVVKKISSTSVCLHALKYCLHARLWAQVYLENIAVVRFVSLISSHLSMNVTTVYKYVF